MPKFSERSLQDWCRTGTDHEKKTVSETLQKIKEGIKKNDDLQGKSIKVFVQGSYANDTNVRKGSDVDVCVMLKTHSQTGLNPGQGGGVQQKDFRKWMIHAMIHQFGSNSIQVGNNSIQIRSQASQIQADVVPCFQYSFTKNGKQFEAIRFFSSRHEEVINFPALHQENGIAKNRTTSKRYKKVIRIIKRVKLLMEDDNAPFPKSISSFLISGLVYNVPDEVFTRYPSMEKTVGAVLTHLREEFSRPSPAKGWMEVSQEIPLFSEARKWKVIHVPIFLDVIWKFMQYD